MKVITVCAIAIAACAGAAHADSIDQSQLTQGAMSVVRPLSGGGTVTVTAYANAFDHKTVGTITGVGVASGGAGGEIDNGGLDLAQSQYIHFAFSRPVRVSQLTIAHLYPLGEFNDYSGNERAYFLLNLVPPPLPNGIPNNSAYFEATDYTHGTFANFGALTSYTNVEAAQDGNGEPGGQGGGAWRLTSTGADGLFGYINAITLVPSPGIGGSQASDFSFVDMQFTAVPTPMAATAGLLGLGLVGSRRRRTA